MPTNPLLAPVPLPGMPAYVTGAETSSVVLAAMLATLPTSLDQSQGGFIWDALAPASVQFAQAATFAAQVLLRSFMLTSYGAYLDNRAAEHGVFRLVAVASSGSVTFSGVNGTVIPLGTQVATSSTTTVPSQLFKTTALATIPIGGSVAIPVVAAAAGAAGNVPIAAVLYPAVAISGLTSVTNPAAMTGGLDVETDAAFIVRYMAYVASPPAGGNASDYFNWAIVVPGVGAVSVVPLWNGNGTVGVYLLDTNKLPAAQPLLDTVQAIIAPALTATAVVNGWTLGGAAPTLDATAQTDALVVPTVLFTYAGASYGRLTSAAFTNPTPSLSLLAQAGLWTLRLRCKVNATAGVTPLVRTGIWNLTTLTWCASTVATHVPTDAGYAAARTAALSASQLGLAYADTLLPFAWNGVDLLQVVVAADFVAVVNPTVAAVLTKSAAATSLLAGNYSLAYTYDNGLGETQIGTTTSTLALLAGDKLTWTPPAMPAGCQRINAYMSIAAGSATLAYVGSATTVTPMDFTVLPFAWALAVPGANTALVGDTGTLLHVDQSKYLSTFSSATGAGKAPIGAQVSVKAPASIAINVAATLTLTVGAVVATVRAACTAAVTAYLASIAFAPDPTVRWSKVAAAISAVPGVLDFGNTLTLNLGTANITIPGTSVAVIGTAIWS